MVSLDAVSKGSLPLSPSQADVKASASTIPSPQKFPFFLASKEREKSHGDSNFLFVYPLPMWIVLFAILSRRRLFQSEEEAFSLRYGCNSFRKREREKEPGSWREEELEEEGKVVGG